MANDLPRELWAALKRVCDALITAGPPIAKNYGKFSNGLVRAPQHLNRAEDGAVEQLAESAFAPKEKTLGPTATTNTPGDPLSPIRHAIAAESDRQARELPGRHGVTAADLDDDELVWDDVGNDDGTRSDRANSSRLGPDLPGWTDLRDQPSGPAEDSLLPIPSERSLRPGELDRYATTLDSLPALPTGYGRVVHITRSPAAITGIIDNGLYYRQQGVLNGTSRIFSRAEDARFDGNEDPRFSGPGSTAIVMDVPVQDLVQHTDIRSAPGMVPPEFLVGIIDVSDLGHQQR